MNLGKGFRRFLREDWEAKKSGGEGGREGVEGGKPYDGGRGLVRPLRILL